MFAVYCYVMFAVYCYVMLRDVCCLLLRDVCCLLLRDVCSLLKDSFSVACVSNCGPGSSVGIATGYGLDVPGIEFSAPVQTGPGAHPVSCTVGAGSFPGLKSGRGVTPIPHPLLMLLVMKE
jgi:hypothetical protein